MEQIIQSDSRVHEGKGTPTVEKKRHMKGRFELLNTVKAEAMIIRNLFMTVKLKPSDH